MTYILSDKERSLHEYILLSALKMAVYPGSYKLMSCIDIFFNSVVNYFYLMAL